MNRSGFSLIELLVVIGLISVLLGLATLNFNQWVKQRNIEREVKEMYADLMTARQKSMVTGMNHALVPNTATSFSFKKYSSESEDRSAQGILVSRKSMPYAMVMNPSSVVEFNERGLTAESGPYLICVFSDASPSYDALVITRSRVNMGKILNQGSKDAAACTKSNIEIK
jgi:type IV fimbrial biogenesis protein FimT